jgi:ABC-2 type transport system permease protein
MFVIYLVLLSYYFGYSFEYYGINRLAIIPDLMSIIIPFLLSVIFLGTVIGLLIPRKELATLIVLLSSLPLVFSAGFIWPTSNIPTVINVIAQFFPSTPAINGFLRLNQMGDSIENLVGIRAQLWWLVGLYASISFALMTLKQKRLNTLIKPR